MYKFVEEMNEETCKPRHVRKLNFGQGNLTSKVVQSFPRQKDRVLLLDNIVASIPSVSKDDIVRDWIGTHSLVFHQGDRHCLSPLSGSTQVKPALNTSPIIHNARKRVGERTKLRETTNKLKRKLSDNFIGVLDKNISSSFTHDDSAMKKDTDNGEGIFLKSPLDSPAIAKVSRSTVLTTSPILDRNSYSYNRKRKKAKERKLQNSILKCTENTLAHTKATSPLICPGKRRGSQSPIFHRNYLKRRRKELSKENVESLSETRNVSIDSNMNSMLPFHVSRMEYSGIEGNILCSQKQRTLIRKLKDAIDNDDLSTTTECRISRSSVISQATLFEAKLDVEDSPKRNMETLSNVDLGRVEIEYSNDEGDSTQKDVNIDGNNDSEEDLVARIEDVDTQDLDAFVTNYNHGTTREVIISKSPSIASQDSEATFFFGANQPPPASLVNRLSQKISDDPSQTTNNPNSRSSKTKIIASYESSSPKTSVEPPLQLTIIDSAKKKRKPKRGSLVEKLQTVVSQQVSFIRIWRHHVTQMEKQGTIVPCVTVFVHRCVTVCSRQFLDGSAVEDPFGLLPGTDENKTEKFLRIITIPELVGRLRMKSEGFVQIFPPWDIINDKKLLLNVSYIRVVADNEKEIERWKSNATPIKRSVINNFHCSCIDSGRIISFCNNRTDKPDVIKNLIDDS